MMEVGTGGAFGDPERSPDLSMSEAFDVVQDDHGTLPIGEVHERLLEPLSQLARFRRVAEGDRYVVRQLVRIADFSAADEIERRVGHDPVEPRPEWLVGTKPVERAVRMEESLLDRVLRVLMRQDDG